MGTRYVRIAKGYKEEAMKDRYKFLILVGAFVAAYFIPNGPARGIGRESKRRIYSC